MTSDQYSALAEKVDVILRLLALGLIDEKNRQDQVGLLHRAGLAPRDIAGIIGTTPNTVSVTLSKMRESSK